MLLKLKSYLLPYQRKRKQNKQNQSLLRALAEVLNGVSELLLNDIGVHSKKKNLHITIIFFPFPQLFGCLLKRLTTLDTVIRTSPMKMLPFPFVQSITQMCSLSQ